MVHLLYLFAQDVSESALLHVDWDLEVFVDVEHLLLEGGKMVQRVQVEFIEVA